MSRKVNHDNDMFGMFRNQESIADWKSDLKDYSHKKARVEWKGP